MLGLAMIFGLGSMAQENPDDLKDAVKDKIVSVGEQKARAMIEKKFGGEMTDEVFNRLFKWEPDAEVGDMPKLNLGAYGKELGVAKITNQNHTKEGGYQYTIDITDRRYMNSKIYNNIKVYNKDLKGALIQFTVKGSPLPHKDINL